MSNRRRKTYKRQAQGFIFPVPFAMVLLLAATVALAYLYLNGRCEALGKQIQVLEQELKDVRATSLDERIKWSELTSLESIRRALDRHGLEMGWPGEDRIVRVAPEERPRPEESRRQYARLEEGAVMHE